MGNVYWDKWMRIVRRRRPTLSGRGGLFPAVAVTRLSRGGERRFGMSPLPYAGARLGSHHELRWLCRPRWLGGDRPPPGSAVPLLLSTGGSLNRRPKSL